MRNASIDVLKALASQVIVVHHLLLYTPMSDTLQEKWPTVLGILADEGRYVVQVFLSRNSDRLLSSRWPGKGS